MNVEYYNPDDLEEDTSDIYTEDGEEWCPVCEKWMFPSTCEGCLSPDECFFDESDTDSEVELDFND